MPHKYPDAYLTSNKIYLVRVVKHNGIRPYIAATNDSEFHRKVTSKLPYRSSYEQAQKDLDRIAKKLGLGKPQNN